MVWLRLLTGAFVAISAAAYAQSTVAPASAAAGMKMNYQSAFSDYRSFANIDSASWKRANSDAASLGGHMGQMKHDATPAMMSTPPPAAPAGQASPPAMKAPK